MLVASTGSSLPQWRFQGSWLDIATDLAWAVARWYAPGLGQFVTEDILLGKAELPASRHLYAYASGDPIGSYDPDGRAAIRTYAIQNRGKFRGRVVIALFIQAKYNYSSPFRFHGDNRSFAAHPMYPDCSRSRVCITLDFPGRWVKVQVHNSCTDVSQFTTYGYIWAGPNCKEAFPIVSSPGRNDEYNLVKLSESAAGEISMTWDFSQSVVWVLRPSRTVNGGLRLTPKTCVPCLPKLRVTHDGFPSFEMYYFSGKARTQVYRRTDERFQNMDTGAGDWTRDFWLPQS